ncbi:hypothetical protein CAPTEDRAFT_227882 [Capitella teleta]|uniref:G-protein coupled receptors family 1 profile domain-containing protein n=1 Tax=Capitella teleta TaxID=283909 RepID=R7TU39_CAPTE|nr:hypothetical protein CAPTEDRAFT_227882 [Capitella teleta]|eukprot:ELT97117.1 hypothetical protein CAPTEDRAFT_227882 [Capitella teleta]
MLGMGNYSEPFLVMESAANASGEASTLSPYLQDLSWIEPAERRNASLYINKDFSLCESFHSYCQLRVTVDVFVVIPLCLAGFIGNTIAYFVLKWDSLNAAVSMQLQALAFIDNFYLVCCLSYQSIKTIADCTSWSSSLTRHWGQVEPYMWPVASVGHTATVWLVAVITIDRYFAICRPFNSKILGTPSRVRKAVLLVLLAAILYNSPRFFEKTAHLKPYFCTHAMRFVALETPLRRDKLYYIIYKTICYFLFRILLPFSILIVLNTGLIRSLHTIYKDHATLTQNRSAVTRQRNDHYTLVLVSMVTVFIACELPDVVIRIVSTLRRFTGWTHLKESVSYATVFTNLLLTLNSSINCVVYCLVARRFRKILQRHFCRGCSSHTVAKKSFSSLNSMQIRQETSHELLRFATCVEASVNEGSSRSRGKNDLKTNSEVVMQHSNGDRLSSDASHV